MPQKHDRACSTHRTLVGALVALGEKAVLVTERKQAAAGQAAEAAGDAMLLGLAGSAEIGKLAEDAASTLVVCAASLANDGAVGNVSFDVGPITRLLDELGLHDCVANFERERVDIECLAERLFRTHA
jgi:hypothetical protein